MINVHCFWRHLYLLVFILKRNLNSSITRGTLSRSCEDLCIYMKNCQKYLCNCWKYTCLLAIMLNLTVSVGWLVVYVVVGDNVFFYHHLFTNNLVCYAHVLLSQLIDLLVVSYCYGLVYLSFSCNQILPAPSE